jgi:hypothetical protein
MLNVVLLLLYCARCASGGIPQDCDENTLECDCKEGLKAYIAKAQAVAPNRFKSMNCFDPQVIALLYYIQRMMPRKCVMYYMPQLHAGYVATMSNAVMHASTQVCVALLVLVLVLRTCSSLHAIQCLRASAPTSLMSSSCTVVYCYCYC